LEEISLVADIDNLEMENDYVVLMTIHSAKGLEFGKVFLCGMEDGLFPSYMSITSDEGSAELEEERRLAYVGITRAKEHLTITAARSRTMHGQTQFNRVSRFVKEIPQHLIGGVLYEPKPMESPVADDAYMRAKKAFRASATSYAGSYGAGYSQEYQGSTFGVSRSKIPVYTPVENQRSFESANTQNTALGYDVGDRVRHIKFGDGEVMAIVAGGRDYEVTVDFDKAGTRKMFASFAKLKKI
jgi:DNA helicase-2/ATP-dependent DNA helicase PcrA